MTIDAILLSERRHAVVVLSGRVEPGCGPTLLTSLRVSARSHTVVDMRQVTGVTPEVVKALLNALGQALDRGRTLRIVVRDDRQARTLRGLGLGSMLPLHATLADAMTAVETAIAGGKSRL